VEPIWEPDQSEQGCTSANVHAPLHRLRFEVTSTAVTRSIPRSLILASTDGTFVGVLLVAWLASAALSSACPLNDRSVRLRCVARPWSEQEVEPARSVDRLFGSSPSHGPSCLELVGRGRPGRARRVSILLIWSLALAGHDWSIPISSGNSANSGHVQCSASGRRG
jgi:hypothetical protein